MLKIDISKKLLNIDLVIKLDIEKGSFVCLTGESGSGKTTLLRVLAGLEEAKGFISFDNKIWQDKKIFLPPQKRKIGFVFQDYALFDNMSIIKNLLYVNNDINLANKLLEITDLKDLKDRLPNTLSGGQKQRVALCRAFMNRPNLLLMDEPLSALDLKMRLKLQNEIKELHKEFKTTTIMVSHDMSEIYKLSDKTIVLNSGKVIKYNNTKKIVLNKDDIFEGRVLDIDNSNIIVDIDGKIVKISSLNSNIQNIKIDDKIEVKSKLYILKKL